MIYTVAATRITSTDGWNGARSLPTFHVEAAAPYEAAAKAAEILTGGNTDTVNCAAVESNNAAAKVYEFVAMGGTPLARRIIG
jgi:hypothetical protein